MLKGWWLRAKIREYFVGAVLVARYKKRSSESGWRFLTPANQAQGK
jgi:hypothetical protein